MEFLLTVLGVVLVVEGIPWFLSPAGYKKLLCQLLPASNSLLRSLGLMMMLAGLGLVYLVRG